MCYSAQIRAGHRKFEREFGVTLDVGEYARFFRERRCDGSWRKIPKGLKDAFADPRDDAERELHAIIVEADAAQAHALEAELFSQKKRLADAERALAARITKKASDGQRIARGRMEAAQRNLDDLRRTTPLARDTRIYPGQYAPVLIVRDGRRTLVPMRYRCRLPGWSEAMERKYPGTFNARRDNLGKTWGKLFGHRHGIIVASAFYENVPRHRVEHRALEPGEAEQSLVIEFRPDPPADMLVACLWNHCPGDGHGEGELYSFAAITDAPPPEVAAAGHDRCIVPVKRENLDAWLNPRADDLAAQYAILDDRAPTYFEHRLAA